MIKIVVDSTADMPEALAQQYNITVVPLSVQFGNESFRDGVDISKDDFYRRLGSEQRSLPTTSQPPLGVFEQVYRELTADGSTVLSLHLHSKFSGTVRTAQQAADLVEGADIVVVDSEQIAMGMGYMAIAAAKAAKAGARIEEVTQLIKAMNRRIFLYVGLDTLRYLQQGGRIGPVQAFLGTLLSVKPIIQVANGEPRPLEQVRTGKRVIARMVELVQSQGPLEELAVLYTTDRDQAQTLADALVAQGLFPRDQLVLAQMGGVIGTHIGPGGIGINGVRRS